MGVGMGWDISYGCRDRRSVAYGSKILSVAPFLHFSELSDNFNYPHLFVYTIHPLRCIKYTFVSSLDTTRPPKRAWGANCIHNNSIVDNCIYNCG